MDKEIMIEGTVENIIFHNADNGYVVFALSTEKENIVCTAYIAKINEGENIKIVGNYITHPTYGKQFNIKTHEKTIPTSLDGMEKYLASGVVKGIGAKLSKRIIKHFGEETFDIIEEYPEKLSEIKGISITKALTIGAVFHEQAQQRKVMMFLQEYGISPILSLKIQKKYKENTIEMVQTNPYALADEIFGIGFKTADEIATKIGIKKDSMQRVKSGIKYCLSRETSNGHVYLPKKNLILKAISLLDLDESFIENALLELLIEKNIVQDKIDNVDVIYLNSFYYAENKIAKKLIELSQNVIDKSNDANIRIENFEKENNITLADNQKQAVIESLSSGVLVITGGPGTGKTTTINAIINILHEEGYEIELAAPTGRAAKKMTEATGFDAKTIHRLLGISFLAEDTRRQVFEKNEDETIEADVIIIDESSMVDILLMNSLLQGIADGTRLILVGDIDQLPSVGPGNILRDIINSGCINVTRLDVIFRQAQESAIIMNAHRINNGKYPILNEKEKDFFFVRRQNIDNVTDTILDLITNRLPAFKENITSQDIQVLTPMRKSQLGIENLNIRLQQQLNPPGANKNEKEFRNTIFRVGDRVMHLKNNYNLSWIIKNKNGRIEDEGVGIFNGDEGIVKSINEYGETLTVLFDDLKIVDYEFSQLDELDLSYAITIHKSQGSEYKVVVIPIHSGPYMLLNRNLLYTAITRAKELCVIVGKEETLYQMVDNKSEIERYSSLDLQIKKMHNWITEFEIPNKEE